MPQSQGEKEVRLAVRGMTCSDCERHVTTALRKAGAIRPSADFRRGEAHFWVPGGLDLHALSEAVAAVGYQPGEFRVQPRELAVSAVRAEGRDYDLVIIGSGGAAFSAAIQARKLGARVAMIERGTIGGTCVNIGCVPSKNLLRAAEVYDQARRHPFAGVQTRALGVDMERLIGQKDELVSFLRQHKYEDLVAEYEFTLLRGQAEFVDAETVQIGGQRLTAGAFLVASGASPAVPEIPGLRDVPYLTSTTALALHRRPESLVVIGAGYIALELGSLYRHLGARVTLVQRSQRLLKAYDPEVGSGLAAALQRQGIELVTGVRYDRVEAARAGVRLHVTVGGEPRVIEAERLLVAAGRRPNTAGLGLERAGVSLGEQGEVLVDEGMRTSNRRIYAAGDVTLGPQFVYVAAHQGAVVAENAVGGGSRTVDLRTVPAVIFTTPAVATVGLTEEQARRAGYQVRVSVLPLEAVPRALVNRETTGVFKLVAEEGSGRLLGAHVVAENAGEVIYAATLAVRFGLTVQDLRETLAPYLTMAEGLKLAALTFDTDVSKLSCCAG